MGLFSNHVSVKRVLDLIEESAMPLVDRHIDYNVRTVNIPDDISEYIESNKIRYTIETYNHGRVGKTDKSLVVSFFIDNRDNIFAFTYGNQDNPADIYELTEGIFTDKRKNPLYLSSVELDKDGELTTYEMKPPFRK